ncbi:hypothetical protein ACFSQ3_07985 [Sphingobacterium corticis]|uniref:Uncharacterized protein n=1 Tax=Sphingobacterium corticis TaxID=1812823 RepID=A0ABW5NIF8_9SPHI
MTRNCSQVITSEGQVKSTLTSVFLLQTFYTSQSFSLKTRYYCARDLDGAVGFGLVNIPIKIFGAIQESQLDLDMLDLKDLSNIRYKQVNDKTGKEVACTQPKLKKSYLKCCPL